MNCINIFDFSWLVECVYCCCYLTCDHTKHVMYTFQIFYILIFDIIDFCSMIHNVNSRVRVLLCAYKLPKLNISIVCMKMNGKKSEGKYIINPIIHFLYIYIFFVSFLLHSSLFTLTLKIIFHSMEIIFAHLNKRKIKGSVYVAFVVKW